MSTNSTNSYLKYLPIVLLCGLAPAFAEFWQMIQPRVEAGQAMSTDIKAMMVIGYSVPQIIIVVLLSLHYDRKDALLSLLLCLIEIPVSIYVWDKPQSLPVYLMYRMIQGAPYLAWGFLMLRDKRAMPFLLFLVFPFASTWINNGGSFFYNTSLLSFEIPRGNGHIQFSPLVYTRYLFLFVLHYIVLAECYQWALKGVGHFKARLLQLSNTYTGLQAFLLFTSYRWLILLSVLGAVNHMAFFSARFEEFRSGSTFLSTPVLVVSAIASLAMFVGLLYLYRKFMLEYCFQKGETPSYMYWLFSIPIIGYILFLIILAGYQDIPVSERIEKFSRAVSETGSHLAVIRVFIIVGQVLSMLLAVLMYANKPDVMILLLGQITAVCTIFYLYNHSLIYILLALYVVKMVVMGADADHYFKSYMPGLSLYTNSLFESGLGFYVMFYLAGVLHPEHFEAEEATTDHAADDDATLTHFAPEIS